MCKYDDLVISVSSFSVHCPVGTLYNVIHQNCQSCPYGSYQPVEGQVTCLVCPDHTSTSNNNSKSRNDCKGKTTTLVCSSLSIFTIYSYLLITFRTLQTLHFSSIFICSKHASLVCVYNNYQ